MSDPVSQHQPTPESIRDRIHDTLPTGEMWAKQARHKKVGPDELVIMHPSGKKFKVKISEIVD